MHLKPEELVDLAEGTRAESEAPHLAACAACRGQLADLRAMRSATADVAVPEPSPLFWDHLSQRVHDAVAAETARPRSDAFTARGLIAWLTGSRALHVSLVAAASVLIVVFVASRAPREQPGSAAAALLEPAGARAEFLSDSPIENDASLSLVATLAANLDAGGDAGLANPGSAEHAVTHMNDDELRELRRILQQELRP